jgi:hypothetical protein
MALAGPDAAICVPNTDSPTTRTVVRNGIIYQWNTADIGNVAPKGELEQPAPAEMRPDLDASPPHLVTESQDSHAQRLSPQMQRCQGWPASRYRNAAATDLKRYSPLPVARLPCRLRDSSVMSTWRHRTTGLGRRAACCQPLGEPLRNRSACVAELVADRAWVPKIFWISHRRQRRRSQTVGNAARDSGAGGRSTFSPKRGKTQPRLFPISETTPAGRTSH